VLGLANGLLALIESVNGSLIWAENPLASHFNNNKIS
jgi:hypothetical protein